MIFAEVPKEGSCDVDIEPRTTQGSAFFHLQGNINIAFCQKADVTVAEMNVRCWEDSVAKPPNADGQFPANGLNAPKSHSHNAFHPVLKSPVS